jgi:sporulation protein YlmC with PRC-barrel domain
MQAVRFDHLQPGMDVFDATGHNIGRVTAIARRLVWEPGCPDPNVPCVEEKVLDVHTSGFLGLGERIDVPLSMIESVEDHCIILSRPATELRHHHRLPDRAER